MEKIDHELISRLVNSDPHLKKLYAEHLKLEKAIERFERYAGYSSTVALRQKRLKKEKLQGMDVIMSILNEYRTEEFAEAS